MRPWKTAFTAIATRFVPSSAAICAQLDRERCVSRSSLIASGPIRYQDPDLPGTPQNTWWFVGKNSGIFQFYTLEKVWGFLWRSTDKSVRQAEFPPDSPSIFAQPMGIYFHGTGDKEFTRGRRVHRPLGGACGVPSHPAGDGGGGGRPGGGRPPSGERYSSLVIWCRGYDANGALICANPAQPLE